MVREKLAKANAQLAEYGYPPISAAGQMLSKTGTLTGVFITAKKERFYARLSSGALLYSGPNLGPFVEGFWYAKKVAL